MNSHSTAPRGASSEPSPGERLDSWKEIAAYFNRDKRTVQRWERHEGMPVHRHQHDKQGSVYALRGELDDWWKSRRARIERAEQVEKSNVVDWPVAANAIRTPVPPQVSLRYEALAELGSGGMGVVYKARDRETGEIVALKVLRADLADDPLWMERFKNELRLARKVTHKNVCRIYDFVRTEDCAYISMEYVDGESIRQILNRFGAMNARTCVTIARQICAGLQEAHLQNVIHRDMKPENVMLDRGGQIKLMDFGIAFSPQAQEKMDGKILGTPAYMAPEQAEGKPADVRTDIYGVGLILYEMVTGQPAFAGDTPLEIALKQVHQTPATPRSLEPGLPGSVDSAILQALRKSPAERFQSAEEFAESLEQEFESPAVLEPAQTAELLQPVRAANWQRFDWLLLAVGMAGAILFFLLGNRVLPYEIFRLEITRPEAIAKAESLVRAFAPELRHGEYHARFEAGLQLLGLPKVAAQQGLTQTMEEARRRAHSWSVSLVKAGKTEDAFTPASSQFDFDIHGNIARLRFSPEPDNATIAPTSPDAAKQQAGKYAEQIFDLTLDPKKAAVLSSELRGANWIRGNGEGISSLVPAAVPVEWNWPDPGDSREGVRVWLRGDRLAGAERFRSGEELPLATVEHRPGLYMYLSEAVGGLTFVGMAVIFIAKRLYLRRTPAVIAAAVLMALAMWVAIGISHLEAGPSLKGLDSPGYASKAGWPAFLFLSIIIGITFYAVLAVPFYFLSEASPERAASFSALIKGEYGSRRVGLAVVRGILIGGGLLGAYVMTLAVLGRYGRGGFGTFPDDLVSGRTTAAFLMALARSMSGMIVDTWIIIALPFALALRLTKKPWIAVFAPPLFAVLTATGLDGMEMLPAVPYFLWVGLQILVLSAAFWLTDLLTCMVAVFTVETFVIVYVVMQIFGRSEPWVQRWGLIPWVLVALAGVIVWCMPQLHASYRRLTAAFG